MSTASFSARQMQETRLAATYKLRRELSHADRSLRRTLAHVSLLEALDDYEPQDEIPPRVPVLAIQDASIDTTCAIECDDDDEERPVSPVESDRQDQLSDEEMNSSSSDSVSDEEISDWDDESDDDGAIIYETGGDEHSVIQLLSAAAKFSNVEASVQQGKSVSVNEVVDLSTSLQQQAPAYATVSVEECSDDF